jgi:hypothetical protein
MDVKHIQIQAAPADRSSPAKHTTLRCCVANPRVFAWTAFDSFMGIARIMLDWFRNAYGVCREAFLDEGATNREIGVDRRSPCWTMVYGSNR